MLDENTAWTLFGAYDIAGKTVTIEGRQFVIAGVYKPSDNKYESMQEEISPTYLWTMIPSRRF